jgi:hypothetical protein
MNMLGSAHPTGTTGLKMWAFRTLKNTISNLLSDRFTHNFSPVTPLRDILKFNSLDGFWGRKLV